MDVDGIFPGERKVKVLTSTSTSTLILVFLLSYYAYAIQSVLVYLGASPNFDHLLEFQLHLEEEYDGSCPD